MSGPSLARWDEKTGKIENLFSEYEGRIIKGLNDMTVDSQGSVYVGSMNYEALKRDATPVPGDLYRVDPDGTVTVVGEGYQVSNGLGFSPDGKLLYHADSPPNEINVYDVAPDRTLKNRRVFANCPKAFPTVSRLMPRAGFGSRRFLPMRWCVSTRRHRRSANQTAVADGRQHGLWRAADMLPLCCNRRQRGPAA